MALSAEESKKLLDAIQNLNVSAEVIQEVLQIIRNAGHTGAVDIAEHNNAESAHENTANLAKLMPDGSLRVGANGQNAAAYFGNIPPFRLQVKDKSTISVGIAETKTDGTLKKWVEYKGHVGFVDAAGNAVSRVDAGTAVNTQSRILDIVGTAFFSDHLPGLEMARIGMRAGTLIDGDDYGKSQINFAVRNGSTDSSGVRSPLAIIAEGVVPTLGSTFDIGRSGLTYKDCYLTNAATVASDARGKENITALDGDTVLKFIKDLVPVSYTLKESEVNILEACDDGNPLKTRSVSGTRTHYGFTAQNVRAALTAASIDDAAVWCLANKNDPDSKQMLRYEELIAPMLKVIQMQQERIEALESKLK